MLGDSIGFIEKPNELAITASINNAGEYADYTFTFIPETTIGAGNHVEIEFPDQFVIGLGLNGSPNCSVYSCTVSSRTVSI